MSSIIFTSIKLADRYYGPNSEDWLSLQVLLSTHAHATDDGF